MDYHEEDNESIETGSETSTIILDASENSSDNDFIYPVNLSQDFDNDFTEDDDYSLNTEDDFEFERIFRQESIHFYEERENGRYYIGLCSLISLDCTQYIIANTVSAPTFLHNTYITIIRYLWHHSIIRVRRPKVEIIQLIILNDGTYSAIIKTFWIKIIQRRWKQIYKERQEKINRRKSIASLKYREIRGKYPIGLNILPSINSMSLLRTTIQC